MNNEVFTLKESLGKHQKIEIILYLTLKNLAISTKRKSKLNIIFQKCLIPYKRQVNVIFVEGKIVRIGMKNKFHP